MQPPPPITRALLIAITVLLFVAQVPALRFTVTSWLALPPILSGFFWPWQVLTYAFVHVDVMQWFVNSLAIYMFGTQLEELWGPRRYIQFLLASALTAAAAYVLLTALSSFTASAPLAGSSGVVFGMLLAFAILFPHRRILLFFVADVTMRTAVLVFIGIEIFLMLGSLAGGALGWQSNLAQLFGMAGAYLMILWWRHRPPSYRRRSSPMRRVK
jgi:membrane associated rhomboid family serine protease